jgi:hypothetical protein
MLINENVILIVIFYLLVTKIKQTSTRILVIIE